MNISKMVRDIKKCQKTDPQNMPILRPFTLFNMVYLQNLAIWQRFQYSKRRKMVDLWSFYFQSKKVPNLKQGCKSMNTYGKELCMRFPERCDIHLISQRRLRKIYLKYSILGGNFRLRTILEPPEGGGGSEDFRIFFLVFFLPIE